MQRHCLTSIALGLALACTPSGGDEAADALAGSAGTESGPDSESGSETDTDATTDSGETGPPPDPCEGLEIPAPPLAHVGHRVISEQQLWIQSDHTGDPVVWSWMIQVPLPGTPLEVGSYMLAAKKSECWAGDTDGACDLVCDDTLVVEFVEVTDTCVALRLSQPDPANLPCAEIGEDATGPFGEIVSVDGGLLAPRG